MKHVNVVCLLMLLVVLSLLSATAAKKTVLYARNFYKGRFADLRHPGCR